MTSSTQPQCCQECLIPEHDTMGEDYRGAVPDACRDEGCPCHQQRQEWEEGLKDAYYGDFSTYDMIDVKYEDVKDFISTTLASERKALLEELLREMPKEYAGDLSLMELFQAKDIGYNKALTTIKSLIEKKLNI